MSNCSEHPGSTGAYQGQITNPWGAQVGYGYDKAGRLQNVSGSGYLNVSNYASALSYRAFGAIKGMSYADGKSLSTAYDNRLRPTSWNIANVLGYNYTYQGDYLDERTGRVTYAHSLNDATLDRSYEYDNAGRLAISHSGAEARAHVGLGQWGTLDGPYSQGYDYDVWGNVTHKYGWGGEVQGGGAGQSSDIYYSYTNNRRNGFTYDAAGNLSNDGTQSFSYDATGQQSYAAGQIGGGSPPSFTDDPLVAGQTIIKAAHLTELRTAVNQARVRAGLATATWAEAVTSGVLIKAAHIVELRARLDEARSALGLSAATYTDAGLSVGYTVKAAHVQELRERVKEALGPVPTTLSQYYDGNGLRVKKTENGATTYYLRSSVLGGQVVAELNGSGGWTRGYVYQGSSLLAVQQGGVYWMHEDPVTKSKRVTNSAGAIVSTVELDPWGADTNRSSNSAFQPKKFTSYDRDANGTDEAMFRRYNRKHSRFDQPDPYDGSYSLTNPQSFNRYAYVNGDPVNFVDPSGLRTQLAVVCSLIDGQFSCESTLYWIDDDPFSDYYAGKDRPRGGHGEPREPQNPQQPNSCEKFAQSLADYLFNNTVKSGMLPGQLNVPDSDLARIGVIMQGQAVDNVDFSGKPYKKRKTPIDGFQPGLVSNGQDADVYHHILFTAGGVLDTNWGNQTNGAFLLFDQQQAYRGRKESETEVRDDYAGIAVGQRMLIMGRLGRRADFADLTKQMADILCQ